MCWHTFFRDLTQADKRSSLMLFCLRFWWTKNNFFILLIHPVIDYKCSRCKSLSVMAHYVGHDDPAPIPTCTEDKPDSFLSAQCATATVGSDCYCADEFGKKINGSDTTFSTTLDNLATSCNQIRNGEGFFKLSPRACLQSCQRTCTGEGLWNWGGCNLVILKVQRWVLVWSHILEWFGMK